MLPMEWLYYYKQLNSNPLPGTHFSYLDMHTGQQMHTDINNSILYIDDLQKVNNKVITSWFLFFHACPQALAQFDAKTYVFTH